MEQNANNGLGIIGIIIGIAIAVLVAWVLLKLNKYFFRKRQEKNNGLYLMFFKRVENAFSRVCILIFIRG